MVSTVQHATPVPLAEPVALGDSGARRAHSSCPSNPSGYSFFDDASQLRRTIPAAGETVGTRRPVGSGRTSCQLNRPPPNVFLWADAPTPTTTSSVSRSGDTSTGLSDGGAFLGGEATSDSTHVTRRRSSLGQQFV
eukprot:gnl/TRDRNA2_/TRDRNA2_138263_c1_seq1.p1 gnl/TRDRNA2_/TRDRNA2_138263_c1~~gnl/TRDRNA2_/TRDRNA2_138263_c1_seq1.p1  ORF type:complete len:136 (+),score=10.41 gnl/TRDRNA2_/TRDRNA2_138263_c1_seq1:134-541(+)